MKKAKPLRWRRSARSSKNPAWWPLWYRPLGASQYKTARELVRAQFFLMHYVSEEKPGEGRRRAWFTAAEAQRALLYEDARLLIAGAARYRERA